MLELETCYFFCLHLDHFATIKLSSVRSDKKKVIESIFTVIESRMYAAYDTIFQKQLKSEGHHIFSELRSSLNCNCDVTVLYTNDS